MGLVQRYIYILDKNVKVFKSVEGIPEGLLRLVLKKAMVQWHVSIERSVMYFILRDTQLGHGFTSSFRVHKDLFGCVFQQPLAMKLQTWGVAGLWDWRNRSGGPSSAGMLITFILVNLLYYLILLLLLIYFATWWYFIPLLRCRGGWVLYQV